MPATSVLFRCISLRRSKGEESRDENRMEGPGSGSGDVLDIGGAEESVAVVGGLEIMGGDEDSRIEP